MNVTFPDWSVRPEAMTLLPPSSVEIQTSASAIGVRSDSVRVYVQLTAPAPVPPAAIAAT
jgi:hypothetical protein